MRFGLLYEHQLPRPVDRRYRAPSVQGRAGAGRAGRPARHRPHLGGRASLPRGVRAFLGAGGVPRRLRRAHQDASASATASCWRRPATTIPARVAERIATLDLISDGRVDWGTGESASRVELEGFGIDPEQKKAMWAEAVEQTANMMAMSPYPGFKGKFFSMPVRNVVPKPLQKPHPPIWVACSTRETIHAAARAGIGALTFAFVDPAEAGKWAHEYYEIIKSDAVRADRPHGQRQRRHGDRLLVPRGCATRRAGAAPRASSSSAIRSATTMSTAIISPASTDVWERFEAARDKLPPVGQRQRHRHAGRADRAPAQLPGRRRRPGGVHPAGRQQQARAYLRVARAVRRQGDAGAQGRPGRA